MCELHPKGFRSHLLGLRLLQWQSGLEIHQTEVKTGDPWSLSNREGECEDWAFSPGPLLINNADGFPTTYQSTDCRAVHFYYFCINY